MAIIVRGLFLKIPPIAARSHMGNFSQKSYLCSPLQPTPKWAIFVSAVIPQKSSHCSSLQPAPSCAILFREGISSKVLPLQPIAAHSYVAIIVSG